MSKHNGDGGNNSMTIVEQLVSEVSKNLQQIVQEYRDGKITQAEAEEQCKQAENLLKRELAETKKYFAKLNIMKAAKAGK